MYLNDKKGSIAFYNLANKSADFEVKLQSEGLDSVGKVKGVFVHSLDSIFVLSPIQYRLSLVNRRGQVINSYNLEPKETLEFRKLDASLPVLYNNQNAFLKKEMLSLVALPNSLPFRAKAYKAGKINIELNLKSKKFDYNQAYPISYTKKNYSFVASGVYRCIGDDDQLVYSFAASDSLYSVKGTTTKSYYAGSRYFDEITPINSHFDQTPKDLFMSQAVTSSSFYYILYDKYRKLYYRIAAHPLTLKSSDEDEAINTFLDKPFSIIILDSKFNIIGEQEFKAGQYNLRNIFVGREGLYISKAFYRNKNDNEYLKFSIFRPQ